MGGSKIHCGDHGLGDAKERPELEHLLGHLNLIADSQFPLVPVGKIRTT